MVCETKTINIWDKKFISWITVLSFGVYMFGTYILSVLSRSAFFDVSLFGSSQENPVTTVISFLVFGAGFLMLFILPGWIFSLHFKRLKSDMTVFLAVSLAASVIGLIFSVTVYKIIGGETLNRTNFLVILIMLLGAGLISLRARFPQHKNAPGVARVSLPRISAVFVFILIPLIFLSTLGHKLIDGKPVSFDYSQEAVLAIPLGHQSDALETFGLAHSLKDRILPYWDLEYADTFGFAFTDPPLYPFLCLFAVLLFGESFATLSLMSAGFIILMFLFVWGQGTRPSPLRFFISLMFMLSYLYFFRNNTVVFVLLEHFFMLLIFLTYIFLLRENYGIFFVFATLATLTRFYGIFFVLLGWGAWALFYKDRRDKSFWILSRYGFVVAGILSGVAFIGVLTGHLDTYLKCILIEHFNRLDYFSALSGIYPGNVVSLPAASLRQGVQFLAWCLYSTVFTFPVLIYFSKSREENFYSFICLVYCFLVVSSKYSLPRYVIPMLPLVAMIFASKVERFMGAALP